MAGAISQNGGPSIQQECDEYYSRFGKVPVGASIATKAGILPFKFIIHTVGPYYNKYTPDSANQLLHACILNTLETAKSKGLQSISIPTISSGIFGFPKPKCAEIILKSCVNWSCQDDTGSIKNIRLCNLDLDTTELLKQQM